MATAVERLKTILREKDIPFFSDEDFEFYLAENNGDFNSTAYQMLIIKSEETNLTLSGLTTNDTSKYFKRLASRYRPHHSGVLSGG